MIAWKTKFVFPSFSEKLLLCLRNVMHVTCTMVSVIARSRKPVMLLYFDAKEMFALVNDLCLSKKMMFF